MDTFLFTLQTTNGIIIIWTLFSSPYRQQTELYLYGHFSLHLVENKRNYISMDIFLFTIWKTNGIIFIWTLSLHHIDNKRNYIYMHTFLFTLQTTSGIIFIWTLFSSPYGQQMELYIYIYGHFSLHLIDNKRNYISMGTFLFTIWATNGIIFLWALFYSPYGQQMELYIYMDTFLFTIWTTNEQKSAHRNIIPFVAHMVKRKVPIEI